MKNEALDVLNSLAQSIGISKNSENNGGVQIYKKTLFEGLNNKQQKSLRKKLRDNYVIPLLEQIASVKSKKEFEEKEKGFLKLYSSIFENSETFDFSVFGMLRNNNKVLAEKAEKTWKSFSK